MHRLDKMTSGLVVVAKNDVAHRRLSEQFKSREVHKTYMALVHGRMAADSGEISKAGGPRPAPAHAHEGRGNCSARSC